MGYLHQLRVYWPHPEHSLLDYFHRYLVHTFESIEQWSFHSILTLDYFD
nr:MAG TPA: hypothetical protein [Caudoviricetes sp.]DAY11498.1 MAG TPA: hypothetical protein [Caudoviricetes sp.]